METRKHSKTIGGSFKNEVCAKKRKIDPRSNLEWIWESFYGPFGVFLGPGVVLDRFFSKSIFYAKKSHASIISRIEFWGGRPFKLFQKETQKPKAQSPRAQEPKAQSPRRMFNPVDVLDRFFSESKFRQKKVMRGKLRQRTTIERATDHAHGLEARWRIYTYIQCCALFRHRAY